MSETLEQSTEQSTRTVVHPRLGAGRLLKTYIGGFGKSHFVELAARRALREDFLVAIASLDLVEVPPGKAPQIYRALVRALRYPDTEEHGLRPLIEKALDTPGVVERFVAQSPRQT